MVENTRQHIHLPTNMGDKIADAVASLMGSWRFIIIQSVIVTLWIGTNLWLLSKPYDAYPFILLNLLFSTQAAYAAPVIMMSQNRQAAKDRKRDDHEALVVDGMAADHKLLLSINEQQLALLKQQSEILQFLHGTQSTNRVMALRKRLANEADIAGITPLDNGMVVIHAIGLISKERRKQLQALCGESEVSQ